MLRQSLHTNVKSFHKKVQEKSVNPAQEDPGQNESDNLPDKGGGWNRKLWIFTR